ncbi:MAG: hypothetical protein A2047_00975 [Omnitrophica bacterium GWA2_41_15]|nr:MAG: hypothetical protein A2047_00975 [Omnitrophica bacterium GWA2_41_15]
MLTQRDLILSLIHTPGSTKHYNEPIKGSVKIMKQVFLLQEKLNLHLFSFIPYDLGPVSFQVYDELIGLEKDGLIIVSKVIGEHNDEVDEYSLTEIGISKAEHVLSNNLSQDEKTKIQSIKTEFNNMKTIELLRYIYRNYPKFIKRSVIKFF